MLIENEFRVAAPVEETYRLMVDVQRVAPCIPGAEILGQRDEGGYDARATVKLGPLSVSYRGAAEIVEQDALEGRCCVRRVQNKKGQGTAQAVLTMQVDPDAEGSHVRISSDITVTAGVAQMGRGLMHDVASRMLSETARAREATLQRDATDRAAFVESQSGSSARAVAAKTPNALSLVLGALFRRLFPRRPL